MMELQFPAVPQPPKLAGYVPYPTQQQYLTQQHQQLQQTEATTVLRLRGLPFEAKESDVRAFFGAFSLLHVHLCRRNGKTTGEAYVQLISEEQAQQALMTLDRTSMGRRYIELFPAKEIELKKRRAQESQIVGSVLRMRGLPFTATPQDIINFFEGIQISQGRDSILLTVNANQKPSGEAFVEFPDENTRNEALSRDRKMIGHRYIELFTANKEDVDKALSQQRFIMRQGLQFAGEHLALPMMPLNMSAHFMPGQDLSPGLDISDFLRGLSLSGSQRPTIGGYASQAMDFQGAPIGGFPYVSQPLSPKVDARYVPQTGFVGIDASGWGQEGVAQPICSFPPISSAAMDNIAAVSKPHDSMFAQQAAFPPSSSQQMMCMQGMPMTPTEVNVIGGGSHGVYHPWSTGLETPVFPTFVDHYDNPLLNHASQGFGCEGLGGANMQHPLPDYLCVSDRTRATPLCNNSPPSAAAAAAAFPIHY